MKIKTGKNYTFAEHLKMTLLLVYFLTLRPEVLEDVQSQGLLNLASHPDRTLDDYRIIM